MPLVLVCQNKMQITVLRSLPSAWTNIQKTSSSSLTTDNVAFLSQAKAPSSKHKPSHSSGSYSSYTTSSSKATTTATPGLADEVIHSFLATNADDVDLIHEDLDQIDDLDLEEMDINWQIAMTAIKIKKFYKKTGRRPRVDGKMHVAFDKRKVECFNCHNTGHFARECKFKGSKEGSRQEAGRGQDFKPVQTEKEALMTIDEGQINWVEQTADEELNHALMAFTMNNEVSMCSKLCLDSYNALQAKYDELQSEFGDQEATFKCHKLAMQDIMTSLYTADLNSSTHYSTCPSNDNDGELGAVSDHSVNDDPIHDHIPIPSIEQVSHLIKDCDYYEKKMAREAALKSQRVVHANVWQATPAWTNTNRVNKANHVHVNSGTEIKSGSSRFNTGKQHVNSGSVHVNSGTQIKSDCNMEPILKIIKNYPKWDLLLLEEVKCKKQTIVATSTTEAEYVAAARLRYYLELERMFAGSTGHEKDMPAALLINANGLNAGYTEISGFPQKLKIEVCSHDTIQNLTTNSLVKQFWQTATARTLADDSQLNATIDSIEYTITEESVRRQLQLADASGLTCQSQPSATPPPTTPPPQPSSVQLTSSPPPIQPVQPTPPITFSSPPITTIPDTQPTHPPSPQIPSPLHNETEDLVSRLESRVESLEKELSDTKQTLGTAVLKLIKKVTKLENKLRQKRKRKETEDEEDAEDQDQDIPSQTDQGNEFATPEKSKDSGKAQAEQISPSTLEAAQILTNVASEGFKGTQAPPGSKIYKRKPKSTTTPTKVLDFEEPAERPINTANTTVNTSSTPSAQLKW
ncbi:ribonuclease H-like domain-containing protein [Tanacetum coccineum]